MICEALGLGFLLITVWKVISHPARDRPVDEPEQPHQPPRLPSPLSQISTCSRTEDASAFPTHASAPQASAQHASAPACTQPEAVFPGGELPDDLKPERVRERLFGKDTKPLRTETGRRSTPRGSVPPSQPRSTPPARVSDELKPERASEQCSGKDNRAVRTEVEVRTTPRGSVASRRDRSETPGHGSGSGKRVRARRRATPPEYLYHLTHVDNLPSILADGLVSLNQLDRHSQQHTSIALETAQERRRNRSLRGDRSVHDFVPFYLTPLTPMLYSWRHLQDELALVLVTGRAVYWRGVLATDGNLASPRAQVFTSWREAFRAIRWDIVKARFWKEFDEGSFYRAAEVLIAGRVHSKHIERVVVRTDTARASLMSCCQRARDVIIVDPNCFFP